MKSRFCAWLLALPLGLCAQETPEPTLATARDDSYPGETGMHHRVHAWTTTDAAGRQVPHRVVSIATGMHFWDGQAWSPSDARFEVTPEAFAAERMPHKVWLRGNLNVVGSVTVVSPSGEILRSTPVAIALYNAANGESTVIGTIRDCEVVQVSDTEVVFENAFKGDGVWADVSFRIDQATFSQDVVVRGRLDPTAWGFPTNSWIQIITEFYDAPRPGQFDFSGNLDVAEFCRLAQQEGLKVMIRPGPYVCAEWDMGGLPAWLLKERDVRLRSRDPRFLEPARRYFKALGEQLTSLQITRGGPILFVQVENEYGAYGSDKAYLATLRDAVKAAGFDVPCSVHEMGWSAPSVLREDMFYSVGFSGDAEKRFQALRSVREFRVYVSSTPFNGLIQ